MQWEVIIGLEVHIQLNTRSKIFSGASTTYGTQPNTQVSFVDLGLPGVLPVLNKATIEMAIKFGLATNGDINRRTIFARKNYFYPDLPKGYQISQFDEPIVRKGYIDIQIDKEKCKRIGITRAHLEEDAGKSLHEDFDGMTGIDLNRAGVPLLEIVSEPDMRSAKEAVIYLKTLHTLVCYLKICDGNMQEGSFRCDANVSVREVGKKEFGIRTEIKNINSFRFVERAIEYEINRQIDTLENGGEIIQETRLYDSIKNETRSMRTKEDSDDYRYFSDPDLLPVIISEETIEKIKKTIPELPEQKLQRFKKDYGLSYYDSNLLINDINIADFFEAVVKLTEADSKLVANWINGELAAALNRESLNIKQSPITVEQLAKLLQRIHDKTISGKIAKTIFEEMWNGKGDVDQIIELNGLKQVTDSKIIEKFIDEVLKNNPDMVKEYQSGKDKLFAYFIGQVMKISKGKANPQQLNKLLKEKLEL